MKKTLKIVTVVCVFAFSYVGVTYSVHTRTLGGKQVNVTLLSLGTQAQAYCNERWYPGEQNDGYCSGTANDEKSRCFYTTATPNCIDAQPPY